MEITEAPLHAYPHACAVTGRDDGQLIDFAVDIDGVDPHLYLRPGVIEEAGRLIGMVPKAKVDELQKQVAELGEKLDEALTQLEAFKQIKEGYAVLEGATQ